MRFVMFSCVIVCGPHWQQITAAGKALESNALTEAAVYLSYPHARYVSHWAAATYPMTESASLPELRYQNTLTRIYRPRVHIKKLSLHMSD